MTGYGAGGRIGGMEVATRDAKDVPVIKAAKFRDVALRILHAGGHITREEIADEIGCERHTVGKILNSPEFKAIYREAYEEVFGTISERIANERADKVVRANALNDRAMTLVGELMDMAIKHKAEAEAGQKTLRVGIVKVGLEAATEARQMYAEFAGSNSPEAKAKSVPAQVSVHIDNRRALVIQSAVQEAGVDLSDILAGRVVDAKVIEAGDDSEDVQRRGLTPTALDGRGDE